MDTQDVDDDAGQERSIEIKPIEASELQLIHDAFSPGDLSRFHHKRYQVQEKGEGIYLVAWYDTIPLGHFLLRWNGPDEDASGKYPYPTPFLEAGGTRTEYRRRGVATKLIHTAEMMAKESGFTRVGLAVASTDNPDAKTLYENLGYRDWGEGEFTISWEYVDKNGEKGEESEVCVYMFKNL